MSDTSSFNVRRLQLRHYRSIESCDVRLGPFTVLVGPNGSGKSNVVDSLRFVSQALNENLDNALRDRGGVKEVRRRSTGHPTHFGLRFEVGTADLAATYAFQIGAVQGGDYRVTHESCRVETTDVGSVPGVESVERRSMGAWETLEFRQQVAGAPSPWTFQASSMSDGTLRALGVLVALFAAGDRHPSPVAVEEPEAALHPAAAGVLLDALRDASETRQVLATSHSPDLLDSLVDPDELLAVRADGGTTTVARLDPAGQDVMRSELYTAGELLRADQLVPDRAQPIQTDLFA